MSDFQDKYNSWHRKLSHFKSGIRIGACIIGIITMPTLWVFFLSFLIAEIVGIAEEWI